VPVHENLEVICGNKQTAGAETALAASDSRQFALTIALQPFEARYGAVVLDVSPAISLMQTCAFVYARRVLVPVNMDLLSLNGAYAVCEMAQLLNEVLTEPVHVIGFVPCQVHHGLSITHLTQQGLEALSSKFGLPILPAVRTDQTVNRAFSARQPLLQFDPNARASQDLVALFDKVTTMIEGQNHVETA
jgi:chromosome partitioning protein